MEFRLDEQALRPITNEVVVLNGEAYRDAVLQPRIKPLLEAETVDQLLSRVSAVEQSLSSFGTKPKFVFSKAADSKSEILNLKTIVDLTEGRPDQSLGLSSRVSRNLYSLEGWWQASNRVGLGELFELKAAFQPDPYSLSAGAASLVSPLPLGRSLFKLKGFFFNEDHTRWASHSLASHGLSAELRVPLIANFVFTGGCHAIARNVHSISEKASDAVRAAAGSSSLKVSALAELAFASKPTASALLYSAHAAFEAAGAPGDTQFLKSRVQAQCDLPVTPGEELVLSLQGKAGYIHSPEDKLKLCDNFCVGGPDDVLGVERFCMGPKDAGDFIGGQAFYTTRAALLAKFPFKQLSPLRLKAQVDAGVLRSHSTADWQSNIQQLLKDTATVSAAGGLTYASDRAKFNVLYVAPLRSAPSDVLAGALHIGAELHLV